jgi:hypothetical protein
MPNVHTKRGDIPTAGSVYDSRLAVFLESSAQ